MTIFQIQISIREDGKEQNSLKEVLSASIERASEHIKAMWRSDRTSKIIDETVSHMMQESASDFKTEELKDLVQQQRKLERDAEIKSKKPVSLRDVKEESETLKLKLKKSMTILEEVEKKLDQSREDQETSEECVMVLYMIHKQQKIMQHLEKISKKMEPLCDESDVKFITNELKELRQKLNEIEDKQDALSMDKQVHELKTNKLEVSSFESEIYSDVIDIEKKLLSVKKTYRNNDQLTEIDTENRMEVSKVIDDMLKIKEKVDQHLMTGERLDKSTRAKIVEVLLLARQTEQDLDESMKKLDKRIMIKEMASPVSAEIDDFTVERRSLLKTKSELKKTVKDLAERLALIIHHDKESEASELLSASSGEIKYGKQLKEIDIKILQSIDKVQEIEKPKDMVHEQVKDQAELRRIVDDCKESVDRIREIVDKKEEDIEIKMEPITSSALDKSSKSLAKISAVLEKCIKISKNKLREESTEERKDTEPLKALKKTAEKTRQECLEVITKIEDLLEKYSSEDEQTPLENRRAYDYNPTSQSCSRQSVLKKLQKVN